MHEAEASSPGLPDPHRTSLFPRMREATGTVYGDIGTSVLYTVMEITRETIRLKHHAEGEEQVTALLESGGRLITTREALGGLSLVFWALIFLTVKYDLFIMRADNRGEGGTFALWALLKGYTGKIVGITLIGYLVVAAAGLLAADGVITPPISMLGAYEPLGEHLGGRGDARQPVRPLQAPVAGHEQGGRLLRLVHDAGLVPLDRPQGPPLDRPASRGLPGVRPARTRSTSWPSSRGSARS